MILTLSFDHYLIRPIQQGDASGFLSFIDANRGRLQKYFPLTTRAITDRAAAEAYVREKIREGEHRTQFTFLIIDTHNGLMAGCLLVKNIDWRIPKAELAYYVDARWEGRGLTSQALALLIEHCFGDWGMEKLFARVGPDNPGSRRVLEKNGFRQEGLLRQEFRLPDGELIDVEYFGRVRED